MLILSTAVKKFEFDLKVGYSFIVVTRLMFLNETLVICIADNFLWIFAKYF